MPDRSNILCINIGNSYTKLGIFNGDQLIHKSSLKTDDINKTNLHKLLFFNGKNPELKRAMICSVVGNMALEIKDHLLPYDIGAIIADHSMIKNIINNYNPPEAIGIDRLLALSYCYSLSVSNTIVFDLGTATTATFADNKGNLQGGAIMPGIETQIGSLFNKTSQLPYISIEDSDNFIADNTRDSILVGAVLNTVFFIHNYTELIKIKYKIDYGMPIYLTGGYSAYILKYLNFFNNYGNRFILCEDLLLRALKYLYYRQII